MPSASARLAVARSVSPNFACVVPRLPLVALESVTEPVISLLGRGRMAVVVPLGISSNRWYCRANTSMTLPMSHGLSV